MEEKARKLMNAVYVENKQEKIKDTREAFTMVTKFIMENINDSREKSLTLTKLEEAIHWQEARTKDRQRRNVEGRNVS